MCVRLPMFCIAVALTSLGDGSVKILWGLFVGFHKNGAECCTCLEENFRCGQLIILIDS